MSDAESHVTARERDDAPRASSRPPPAPPRTRGRPALAWAFLVVPLVGLVELLVHVVQVGSTVPRKDWVAARDEVQRVVKPDDLVTFVPDWSAPVAREVFGEKLATFARVARPDESRFARALEVSIRGKHDDTLAGWTRESSRKFGRVTVSLLTNPKPAPAVTDLVQRVTDGAMTLTRVEPTSEERCPLVHTSSQTGNIGFGPAIPGDRFACGRGGFAGVTVLADLDYKPRRCIYVPPQGGATVMRLTFSGVTFASSIHGHHAISVHSERDKTGTPVTLAFRVGDRVLGKFVHNDGDSWKPFELPTPDLAGTKGDLVAEVSSQSAAARQYCFEAITQ